MSEVSKEIMELEELAKSVYQEERLKAVRAMRGVRGISKDIYTRLLYDVDSLVRVEATKTCHENHVELPRVRDIEPAGRVYKKCRNGVIVEAEIPLDASVRCYWDLPWGAKCRSDKAVITDIIGNPETPGVAVSLWDSKTEYRVGDVIRIKDFDYGHDDAVNGFHFFLTRGDAEKYPSLSAE